MVNIDDKTKKYRLSIGMYLDGRSNLDDDDDVLRLCDELYKIGNEQDKIWALQQKAWLLDKLEKYTQSLPIYTKLISLYEKGKFNIAHYSDRAKIYLRIKEYNQALYDFTEALSYNPTFNLYKLRAECLFHLSRYSEARKDLAIASKLLESCHESVRKSEGDEINSLLQQIHQKEHPQRNAQTKKTGLKKLVDFGKSLIGK